VRPIVARRHDVPPALRARALAMWEEAAPHPSIAIPVDVGVDGRPRRSRIAASLQGSCIGRRRILWRWCPIHRRAASSRSVQRSPRGSTCPRSAPSSVLVDRVSAVEVLGRQRRRSTAPALVELLREPQLHRRTAAHPQRRRPRPRRPRGGNPRRARREDARGRGRCHARLVERVDGVRRCHRGDLVIPLVARQSAAPGLLAEQRGGRAHGAERAARRASAWVTDRAPLVRHRVVRRRRVPNRELAERTLLTPPSTLRPRRGGVAACRRRGGS
jgi:hypothetical protein